MDLEDILGLNDEVTECCVESGDIIDLTGIDLDEMDLDLSGVGMIEHVHDKTSEIDWDKDTTVVEHWDGTGRKVNIFESTNLEEKNMLDNLCNISREDMILVFGDDRVLLEGEDPERRVDYNKVFVEATEESSFEEEDIEIET